ncbi:MAG TPA: hypothetical protein PKW55_04660 [Spirochaetota bacterium]|nr:hypothetical protein [Spirochaetota bacterium]HOM37870.1 hypothetical protein [Spirochaetota bacterium]HPQ48674.1 hypothetical protein [Spirochaetota bacterium]
MGNFFFYVISVGLLIGGIICAQSFIVKKNPKAEKNLKQLAAQSKIIGILLFVVGIIEIIDVVINWGAIEFLINYAPITGIVFIAAIILSVLIGLILSGESLTAKLKNPEKIDNFRSKIETKKVALGFLGILCGGYLLLFKLFRFSL